MSQKSQNIQVKFLFASVTLDIWGFEYWGWSACVWHFVYNKAAFTQVFLCFELRFISSPLDKIVLLFTYKLRFFWSL